MARLGRAQPFPPKVSTQIAALLAAPPASITSQGGLHHIEEGMGDTGEGARVPQTLHTIEQGISA